MEKIYHTVKTSPLFQGIALHEFSHMYGCLSAKTSVYKKDESILLAGDAIHAVGLVLSGRAKVIREDMDGRIVLMAELLPPDIFGEAFACAGVSESPVTVFAAEETAVLFLAYRKVVTSCPSVCPFHARLIENMLRLIAHKNLNLNQKIEILSKRTTREKLLCFFDIHRRGQRQFTLPFNREELAHYLSVDRSAMSNELSKMRDEGILAFHKNKFELLCNAPIETEGNKNE